MAELLFALPVWNAKVERLFSFMNRVKIDARASLGEKHLNSLLSIGIEGPRTVDFDPMPAMCLWGETLWRPNQQLLEHCKPKEQKEK